MIALHAGILQDGSDQDFIELKTEQVVIKADGLFGWKHFDLKIAAPKAFIDTMMSAPDNFEALIFDAQNELVNRKNLLDKKMYPNPEKTLTYFDSSGSIELKRTGAQELSVRVYRKFKSKSSHHKTISEFELTEGRYRLIVQYSLEEQRIIKSRPIPLLVK